MNESPWYKEGLRFKCTECGKCCSGKNGYVWVTESEMENMAKALNISLELFMRRYTRWSDNRYALLENISLSGDYDCVFLKDKKCMVYQARPTQCRTYPWWKENLETPESWEKASHRCEGINQNAPLVSCDEIEKLVQINDSQNKDKY